MGVRSLGEAHEVFSGYVGWGSWAPGIMVGKFQLDKTLANYAQSAVTADGGAREQVFGRSIIINSWRSGVGGGSDGCVDFSDGDNAGLDVCLF